MSASTDDCLQRLEDDAPLKGGQKFGASTHDCLNKLEDDTESEGERSANGRWKSVSVGDCGGLEIDFEGVPKEKASDVISDRESVWVTHGGLSVPIFDGDSHGRVFNFLGDRETIRCRQGGMGAQSPEDGLVGKNLDLRGNGTSSKDLKAYKDTVASATKREDGFWPLHGENTSYLWTHTDTAESAARRADEYG